VPDEDVQQRHREHDNRKDCEDDMDRSLCSRRRVPDRSGFLVPRHLPFLASAAREHQGQWQRYSLTLTLPPGDRFVERAIRISDAQIWGDADELLLFLWGRFGSLPKAIELSGNVEDLSKIAELLPAM